VGEEEEEGEKQLADLLGIQVKHVEKVAQSESDERKEANITVIKKVKILDKSLTESLKPMTSDKYKEKTHKIKQKGEKFNTLCSVCSKSCRDMYVLKQHMTTHYPENLECGKCAQIFQSEVLLKHHMKRHDRNNLVCDICSGTFTLKRLLQRHIKLTHSESKAPCSSCGQIFTSSSILRHNKICKMTEEEKQDFKINRRVGCKDCGKVLANKTKLNRHIRFIHNNEKLYQCNLCDRQDYNKDNMKIHIKGIHKERDPNTSFSNL